MRTVIRKRTNNIQKPFFSKKHCVEISFSPTQRLCKAFAAHSLTRKEFDAQDEDDESLHPRALAVCRLT